MIFQAQNQQHTQQDHCKMHFDLTGWHSREQAVDRQSRETLGQQYAENHHIFSAIAPKPRQCSQVLGDHQENRISRNSSGILTADMPGYLFWTLSCTVPTAFHTS